MGLDYVEVILAVEDTFEIHIDDADASRILTVGDLFDAIKERASFRESKRCLTSAAFYRTRRGFCAVLGVDRRSIKPATPLVSLLPKPDRRRNYELIRKAIALKLPELVLPTRVDVAVVGAVVVATLALALRQGWGFLASWPLCSLDP